MELKKEFGEYTINSAEIKKGLELIPTFIPIIVVGGVAVQIYCKQYFPKDEKLLRVTNDTDFLPEYLGFISKNSLVDIGNKFDIALYNQGFFNYHVSHSKNRGGYEIAMYDKSDNTSPVFFHLSTFSEGYWKKHYDEKKREIENANIIKTKDYSVKVHNLEDLVVNKTKRLNFMDNQGLLDEEESQKLSEIRSGNIKIACLNFDPETKIEEFINLRRENYCEDSSEMQNKEYLTYLNNTKILKDFYDLGMIGMIVEDNKEKFNIEYFLKSMKLLHNF
ncbi:MAG: hypothetical protein WC376_00530 [Candidatus Nanoarchaeia archaeon]|jgi:hypothetical protein